MARNVSVTSYYGPDPRSGVRPLPTVPLRSLLHPFPIAVRFAGHCVCALAIAFHYHCLAHSSSSILVTVAVIRPPSITPSFSINPLAQTFDLPRGVYTTCDGDEAVNHPENVDIRLLFLRTAQVRELASPIHSFFALPCWMRGVCVDAVPLMLVAVHTRHLTTRGGDLLSLPLHRPARRTGVCTCAPRAAREPSISLRAVRSAALHCIVWLWPCSSARVR